MHQGTVEALLGRQKILDRGKVKSSKAYRLMIILFFLRIFANGGLRKKIWKSRLSLWGMKLGTEKKQKSLWQTSSIIKMKFRTRGAKILVRRDGQKTDLCTWQVFPTGYLSISEGAQMIISYGGIQL